MQTMPTKTRTSLLISGAAVLVVVAGVLVWGLSQRSNPNLGGEDPMVGLAEAENGLTAEVGADLTEPAETVSGAADASSEATGSFVQDFISETGLAASPDGATLNSYEAVPLEHVVAPNETLYEISMKYYDTHIYAGDIEALNQLEDPNVIQAGTKLQLPRPEELENE